MNSVNHVMVLGNLTRDPSCVTRRAAPRCASSGWRSTALARPGRRAAAGGHVRGRHGLEQAGRDGRPVPHQGPDLVRGIYPTAKIVNATGITDVSEQQIRGIYDGLIATRRSKEN